MYFIIKRYIPTKIPENEFSANSTFTLFLYTICSKRQGLSNHYFLGHFLSGLEHAQRFQCI